MKFLELDIKNFLTIKEAKLNLADKGLVLVQGVNLDDPSAKSNGAGKSSIVDALCWAVYGQTARGVSGDAVINKTAKKNCAVSVSFQEEGLTYTITRRRGTSGLEFSVTNEMGIDYYLTKGTEKETQEIIEKTLGCSYEVFSTAIYAGQERMPDIPMMTDKQLKLLIEEAAGVTRLSQAYELSRGELNKQSASYDTQKLKVEAEKKSNAESMTVIEEIVVKKKAIDANGEEKSKQIKLRMIEKLKLLKACIAEVDAKKPEAEALRSELAGVKLSIADYEKSLEPANAIKDKIVVMEKKLSTATMKMTETGRELDSLNEGLDVSAKIGTPCSECGKPYEEHDFDEMKKHHQEKVEAAQVEAERWKKAVAGVKSIISGLQSDLERATPASIGELIARQTELEDSLKVHEGAENNLLTLRKEIDADKQALDDIAKAENPFTSTILDLERKLIAQTSLIADMEAVLASMDEQLEVFRDAVKVFSPAGVRAHILDSVTPFLNDRTAHYLNILSDGNISAIWSTLSRTAKGEIREKFSIDVQNDKGATSFDGLSGGEKRKVRLSCTLALQDLVSSRATKPIDIWIGDEVDHALDDAGLERLMSILNDKAKEKGTVLVISHNSLTDWIDDVATVTKTGGYSEVEGALCL